MGTLIDIKDPAQLESGIQNSVNPLAAALWVDGSNVVFADGGVAKSAGFSAGFATTALIPIRGATQVIDSGVQKLYYGDTDNLYMWNATGAPTEVSKVTDGYNGRLNSTVILPATHWSSVSWGTWAVMSNGVDPIQVNKGTGNFQDLGGTPPGFAKIIKRMEVYLLAFGTDRGGEFLEWCAADNVDDWPTAHYLPIRNLDSEIMAVEPLGRQLAVYSRNSMVVVSFLGGDSFGAKHALDGIGAVGVESVVSIGRKNYGWGQMGIWVTDGSSFEYIDPPEIRRWINANLNDTQKSKITGFWNEDEQTIEWSIPTTTGEPDIRICYAYKKNTWSFKSKPFTTALSKGIFAYPIIADAAGDVFFEQFGVDADGGALAAHVTSKPLSTEAHDRYALVNSARFKMHDVVGVVEARVGSMLDADATPDWSDYFALETGFNEHFFEVAEGIYHKVEIRSTTIGAKWLCSGFQLRGELTGDII